MNKKDYQIAKEFNILERVKKLENDLLKIKGVSSVEFDLCGFYDDIYQVIFLTEYDILVDNDYFKNRKELINRVLETAKENGLTKEDPIQDYGKTFYFVTRCDKDWIK